jgi:hypothetical protein
MVISGKVFAMFFQKPRRRRQQLGQDNHRDMTSAAEVLETRRVLAAPADPVEIADVIYHDPNSTGVYLTPVADAIQYEVWASDAAFRQTYVGSGTSGGSGGILNPVFPSSQLRYKDTIRVGYLLTTNTGSGNRLRLWARALNDDGVGPWGPPLNLIVGDGQPRDQVQLDVTALYTGSGQQTVPLSWPSRENFGATRYEIWGNHDGTRLINEETTSSEFQSEELETGLYKIWVRAESDVYNAPWSKPMLVAVGADRPEVTGPVINEAPLRPRITWSAGLDGLNYQVWVQAEGQGVVINETGVTGTSYTPTTDLSDGLYSAWVRQVTDSGEALPWSSRYRFAVGVSRLPETPVLQLTPNLNGDDVEDYRAIFTWNAAANAARFELHISRRFDGVKVFGADDLTGTTYTTPALPSGIYRAWLRSIGANGELSLWSEAYVQFEVIGSGPRDGQVILFD